MSFIEEEVRTLLGDAWKDSFKGFSNVQVRKAEKRPEDVHHKLNLSLEKLYTGATIRIRAEKKIPCSTCSVPRGCLACKGSGFISGQSVCTVCKGIGALGQLPCRNPKCMAGQIREEKYFSVCVPAGAWNSQKITLKGQGDALIDKPSTVSDIVCIVNELPHERFQRCYNDLYCVKTIDIRQALCGCLFSLTHLDGRGIAVRSKKGVVIKPGDMRVIMNEGMPIQKSDTRSKGDLIVTFNIEFPKTIDQSIAEKIEVYLPNRGNVNISEDNEECSLVAFDPKDQVYHVPFHQKETYEDSPAKGPASSTIPTEPKAPQCVQQ